MKNKMKNKIVLLGFLMFGMVSLYAQKGNCTIGLYTGVQGQFFTFHREEYHKTLYTNSETGKDTLIGNWQSPYMRMTHTFSNIPPIELLVRHNVSNRFSMLYGVGYRSYFTKIKGGGRAYYADVLYYTARTDFIQIPIICQYDMPMKKNGFSFFLQWGLCFDVEIKRKSWWHSLTEQHDWRTDKLLYVETSINSYWGAASFYPLFHTGFGFSYQFNSGIGISLSGKHNIGLSHINKLSYNIKFIDAETGITEREFKEYLSTRSESWNVLLGITYTFKKKENGKL